METTNQNFGDPKKAWEKISAGALLIDVRTSEEFSEGHIEGAKNVPLSEIEANPEVLNSERGKEIVVYCARGRRSDKAEGILVGRGFSSVFNGGGYQALVESRP